MARFLVTGGAGFIGSHLVETLLNEGHSVRVLDDLSSGHRKNLPPQAQFTEADVTDPEAVDRAFEGIDGCFHLAAIASVERSHAKWLRTHMIKTMTQSSSDSAGRRVRKYCFGGVIGIRTRPRAPQAGLDRFSGRGGCSNQPRSL